ncbi:MAG: DUF3014 domain-containing protein [bacterium]|nr:DUF3014 domain-containing protein [bacterium]
MSLYTRIGIAGALISLALIGVVMLAGDSTPSPPNDNAVTVAPLIAEPDPVNSREPVISSAIEDVPPTFEPHNEPTSDEGVMVLVRALSTHPRFAAWLLHDGLLKRFVSGVESIAEGYSPRDEFDFIQPMAPFVVQRYDDELVISEGSFRRFNVVTDVFCSIDTKGTVAVYRQIKPNISKVHHEISWIHPDFDERLVAAIDHLLQVSVPSGPMVVERGTVTFSFADQTLENLTDAQRQLLRMGPHNARRIQSKLAELRAELYRTEPTTPGMRAEGTSPSESSEIVTLQKSTQSQTANIASSSSPAARPPDQSDL